MKRDLNNIKQKLEVLTEMNETLFLVKEVVKDSTPDRKPKGEPPNRSPLLTFLKHFWIRLSKFSPATYLIVN